MRAESDDPAGRCAGIADEAAEDLTGQIAAIQALGWHRIELRNVGGKALADLGDAERKRLAHALREAELDVVCLASRIGNWARPVTACFDDDLAELDTLLAQCVDLGCRYVRVMSYPNDGLPYRQWTARVLHRLTRLAERARQAGVTLLHENCAGWAARDPARMVRLVEEAGPALRLLFDMGNGVPHGYDAHAVLKHILPHVEHVHVKDARRSAHGVRYVLPGDGDARVTDCLQSLLHSGYRGAFSLEPHLAVQPHRGLRAYGDAAQRFAEAGHRLDRLLTAHLAPAATADPRGGSR